MISVFFFIGIILILYIISLEYRFCEGLLPTGYCLITGYDAICATTG